MTEEEILKSWRIGRTKYEVADIYKEDYNKKAEKNRIQ